MNRFRKALAFIIALTVVASCFPMLPVTVTAEEGNNSYTVSNTETTVPDHFTYETNGNEMTITGYIPDGSSEPKFVDVNFSSTYGSIASKQAVLGRPYGELPELAHTFYTFEGWYLDQNYAQKITADTIVTAEAEHTLYAKWSAVTSQDNSVRVTDKGSNVFDVTLAHSAYKQIRFKFNVEEMPDKGFSLSYEDNDNADYNNAFITVLDENNGAVRFADVEAGQWYTAVIFGADDQFNSNGNHWKDATLVQNFTLTVGFGVQMQVEQLETLGGQLGYRLYTFETAGRIWQKVSVPGYGYAFDFHMSNPATHELTGVRMDGMVAGQYATFTYDFCIYERIDGAGNAISNGEAAGVYYASWSSLNPVFYDLDGNQVDAKSMKVGAWYKAVVNMTGKSGQMSAYSFNGDNFNTSGSYKAYFANLNWIPAENQPMIDNIGTANTVTLTKNGTAGTFVAERISRDLSRVTYSVSDSATWTGRTLKVTLNDTTKEFIQVDFRFLSAQANGSDVAPTMLVSTVFSGTPAAAKYIIVDENDDPVTSLETGKWYRLFITANGANRFALLPMGEATAATFKVQLQNLNTYNADELDVKFNGMNLALSKFGKLEYVSTGSKTVTVDASGYKQIRFTVKGGTITGTGVTTAGTGTWKTVVITNNGNDLGNLTLQLSGNVRIQNLKAYTTADAPVANPSTQFRGLEADEMLLQGFLGPRDGYTTGSGELLPSLIRDDIFAKIAQAGINYIADNNQSYSGSTLESSKEVLRLAAKYGIQYYMPAYDVVQIGVEKEKNKLTEEDPFYSSSDDLYRKVFENTINEDAIREKLREMYQYESFGGLYLRDEPYSDLFDEILKVNTILDEIEKEMGAGTVLNRYLNMFPDMGSSGGLTNFQYYTSPAGGKGGYSSTVLNWDNYLKAGALDTGMDYVSFDMYPFLENGNSPTFLNYLGRANKAATEAGVPWMGAAQIGGGKPSYGNNRPPTEAETNWNVNAMLAFGAKGILYYVNVSPPYFNRATAEFESKQSLINIYGQTTEYYDYVKKINAQIQAIDHVLMNATHKGVILTGGGIMSYDESVGKTTLLDTASELNSVKLNGVRGTALIGAFDYNGKTALLVVNNDVEKESKITLNFTGNYTYEIIMEANASRQIGAYATLKIAAGRCALVVLHEDTIPTEIRLQFDLNYETGASAPDPITMTWSDNAKYPALPVVTREGYDFGGWYLNAACSGTPVAAGQLLAVNGGHMLYAKWTMTPDTSPVVVKDNASSNPNQAIITHNVVAGKHIYTYTTKGTVAPSESPWARRLSFTGWSADTKYVAIEFRYTEAYAADGVTEIQPSLGVYNGQSGVGYPRIFDTNGNVVAAGNATTGLTVGQWYTVVIEPGTYTSVDFWTAHNYNTDAPILTMEIRECVCTADTGLMQDSIKFETVWGDFADPVVSYMDGNWCYNINGSAQKVTAEYRQLNVTLKKSNIKTVAFEFTMNGLNGTRVSIPGGVNCVITNTDGSAVSGLKADVWYKATATAVTTFDTTRFVFGYLGGDGGNEIGGLNCYIRSVQLTEADSSAVALAAIEGEENVAVMRMTRSATAQPVDVVIEDTYLVNGVEYTVTGIGSSAFYDCAMITTITLPGSLTTIGNYAFAGCTGLKDVHYNGTEQNAKKISIGTNNDCLKDATWHYHSGEYTVFFVDEDGAILSSETYHWGDKVNAPADPSKVADETYTYTFAGWGKEIVNCAGDAVYTATYNADYIEYTVIFADEDGTELSKKTYHWGDTVEVPTNPTKPADNHCTYTFAGWDKEATICRGSTTYTAIYESTYKEYTVIFVNEDGSILYSKDYHWGDEVDAPAPPEKAADSIYTYTFAGWDKEIVNCAGNAIYTATYDADYIEYTVIFADDDGTVLSSGTYHWGDRVDIPTVPAKAADNTYTYTFKGWDKEVTPCQGNTTYTATYEPTYKEYTIMFVDEDGNILFGVTYHWGDTVEVPANPTKPADNHYTYTFKGWDKEVTSCQGNAIYTAVFTKTVIPGTTVPGDVNGDGQVTDADAVYLLYYTFLPEDYPIDQNCDFNGDGNVTDADAVYLLYYTFLPDQYPIN